MGRENLVKILVSDYGQCEVLRGYLCGKCGNPVLDVRTAEGKNLVVHQTCNAYAEHANYCFPKK
jgi:hypothetical protein